MQGMDSQPDIACPFVDHVELIDLLTYQVPVVLLLGCNIVFLVWIMVVSRLYQPSVIKPQ